MIFEGPNLSKTLYIQAKSMIFRFSTGSRFGFQNASKMRSPGIPKLENEVSGISSFLGVVFGSTFDEK